MTNISIIIVTTLSQDDRIPSYCGLDTDRSDIEIIVRRDAGVAQARNAGIREASADKVVFLDDDAIPHQGFIDASIEALSEHMVVAGRVVEPPPFPISGNNLYEQGSQSKQTDIIVGCNMGMRREVFDEVGYFNPVFTWGHEEEEWKARALACGYQLRYIPEMIVSHISAASWRQHWSKQYLKGVSDAYLWDLQDASLTTQLQRVVPMNIRRNSMRESIGRLCRKCGRLKGNWRLWTGQVNTTSSPEYGDYLNVHP